MSMTPCVAVVVTHRRPDELAKSLDALAAQTRPPDHLIVVDNDRRRSEFAIWLPANRSRRPTWGPGRNLGGAGGFALGMLHALALGADWVWLADDDGRPHGPNVLSTLLACATKHGWPRCRPWSATSTTRSGWRSRCGAGWCGVGSSASCAPTAPIRTCCPGSRRCSTAPCSGRRRSMLSACPDLRLFVRGDEVEVHRRLVRSGLPFGTCLDAVYLHPQRRRRVQADPGRPDAHPVPRRPTKRFFTYRNRGYLQSQPGMRKLVPQEWVRFGWFFLVTRRDPAGLREWIRLRRLGRRERFGRPATSDAMTIMDAAAQSKTFGGRGATSSTVSASANCGCTSAGRTSSSATAARCSARSGSPSPPAPPRWRWAACTPSCSNSNSPSTCRMSRSGLIIWNLINASILEGADVFIANEGLIKQLPTPLSVHVYRLVWRQMILFGHNIVIYVIIAIIFPKPWTGPTCRLSRRCS